MRTWLPILVALAATLACASARGETRSRARWRYHAGGSGIVFQANFTTTGCIAAPVAQTGQAITVTRASTKRCGASLATCANNELCVETDGALIEPSRTNNSIRSEEFDNAAWTKTLVTATANTHAAPDGTTTADTLATTAVGGDVMGTGLTAAATVYTGSVYVRSTAGTQSFDFRIRDSTGLTDVCALNAQTATTTWQRFACVMGSNATAGNTIRNRIYPGTSTGSGTVVAWGSQLEAGSFATSYIATAGTAATRAADNVSVPNGAAGVDAAGCARADARLLGSNANARILGTTGSNTPLWVSSSTAVGFYDLSAVTSRAISDFTTGSRAARASWAGSGASAVTLQSALGSTFGAYDGTIGQGTLYIGSEGGTANHLGGWVKNIKVGTKASGCPL